MPHIHHCIHAQCFNRFRCETDRADCLRDDSFECVECCVRELKERRPEVFIEAAPKLEAVQTKKGKSRRGTQKEVLFQS